MVHRISCPAHVVARGHSLRLLAILFLIGGVLTGSAGVVRPGIAMAGPAGPDFAAPARGVPATQSPGPTDFTMSCNAEVNKQLGHVNGTTISAGGAVQAAFGCGLAVLFLDVPGTGRLHASYGMDDQAAQISARLAVVRIHVIGRDGYDRAMAEVSATRGAPRGIDVDVSNAAAVAFEFRDGPSRAFLYNVGLSGAARALGPTAGNGAALPVGATPVNLAAAAYSCVAQRPDKAFSVARVALRAGTAASAAGCGQITLGLPAGTRGTLAFRYGMEDTPAHPTLNVVTVRALAANGRVLRKAIGIAALGGGLRPLWIDLRGAATVNIAVAGNANNHVVFTGAGILPGRLPLYQQPNRVLAAAPGTSAPIDAEAFVIRCAATAGDQDTAVQGRKVLAGSYIRAEFGCGAVSLVLGPRAHGSFHATFGVADDARGGAQPSVHVVVQDRTNHPLVDRIYRAPFGSAGVPVDLSVEHASVLSIAFNGPAALLYDMTLTGDVFAYDRVYPQVEPGASMPGGVAVDPRDFALYCNAEVAKTDVPVVHETTLEGWALLGAACGSATLDLAAKRYPRGQFTARAGIQVAAPPTSIIMMRRTVLDAGRTVRQATFAVRYGYGPLPIGISLAGGTRLRIAWLTPHIDNVAVYAMSAS